MEPTRDSTATPTAPTMEPTLGTSSSPTLEPTLSPTTPVSTVVFDEQNDFFSVLSDYQPVILCVSLLLALVCCAFHKWIKQLQRAKMRTKAKSTMSTSRAINVATSDTLDVVATVQVIETDKILEGIYKETMCTHGSNIDRCAVDT